MELLPAPIRAYLKDNKGGDAIVYVAPVCWFSSQISVGAMSTVNVPFLVAVQHVVEYCHLVRGVCSVSVCQAEAVWVSRGSGQVSGFRRSMPRMRRGVLFS